MKPSTKIINISKMAELFDRDTRKIEKEFLWHIKSMFMPTEENLDSWEDTNLTPLSVLDKAKLWKKEVISGNRELVGVIGFKNIVVSRNPQPDYLPYKEEIAILKGVGKIPNLFIYSYKPSAVQDKFFPKDLAHDNMFFVAFSIMFNGSPKNEVLEATKKFIVTNKVAINKLRSSFKEEPRKLGSGLDGIVFSIGGGRILKIFTDDTSFQAAKDAHDRIFKSPIMGGTEAMIYDLGKLGVFEGTNIYYYIMEKMTPVDDVVEADDLNGLLKSVSSYIISQKEYLSKIKNDYKEGKFNKNKADLIKAYAEIIKNQITEDDSYYYEKVDAALGDQVKEGWFERLIEEMIYKYITSRTDLHSGNLGITGYGELRYFDPAHNNWSTGINVGV